MSEKENDKPTQSTFKPIKSDMLDAFLHALPDHWKLDWWKKQLSIYVPTHKLVKWEDLEWLINGIEDWRRAVDGQIEWTDTNNTLERIKEECNL